MPTYYEFFAGGGMARAGLGRDWECLFANDYDPKKCAAYASNWGLEKLHAGDVSKISTREIPSRADLAWASFPCQDLSRAGAGAGLKGGRSGAFWPFWRLISNLQEKRRAPRVVVLENVCGALTSHEGKDFVAIATAMESAGYRFGAVVVDAARFVPQSRPRLFFIGVSGRNRIPKSLLGDIPVPPWHPAALIQAYELLPKVAKKKWLWWRLPDDARRRKNLLGIIESNPRDVKWDSKTETKRLLSTISRIDRAKVKDAQLSGKKTVGTVYKRMRKGADGGNVQRSEIRLDNVAGCLRTPSGGSSLQSLIFIHKKTIRSRLLSSREAARLMGLSEKYVLPPNYYDAYHLVGDGVAVPVVRFLEKYVLKPIVNA